MWDYKQCDEMCSGLKLNFSKVKVHLDWAAGYAKAIDKGKSRFCYGGADNLHPHDLKFARLHVIAEGTPSDGQEASKDGLEMPFSELDVNTMERCCSPAPYGNLLNESTQVNPAVRKALGARFVVAKADVTKSNDDDWDPRRSHEIFFETRIRAAVMERLCFYQKVYLEPYKLNIYGPGDFFRPHVDTPVDPELFVGTVVVCLPAEFTGGELIVTHGRITQTFDFATRSGERNVFQFAAFFGDCPHEIRPVTSGRRVTLTYHILRERCPYPGEKNFEESAYTDFRFPVQSDESRQETVREQFKAELRTLSSLGLPYVGFLLQHEYTQSGAVKEGLKGSDRMFHELLTSEGWPCRFVPVLLVSKRDRDWWERHSSAHECEVEVLSFRNQDYEFLSGYTDEQPALDYKSPIPFTWYNERHSGRLLQNLERGEKFLGNSTVPGKELRIYLQTVMIVDLRPEENNWMAAKATDQPNLDDAGEESEEEEWSYEDIEEDDNRYFDSSAWRRVFKKHDDW
ncbi:hypothetical protein KFL_004440070 [Klebsormidium nitens]|uniref:Fe2OG dioxygenase domain-containing protein n=1 Tax=Klebsormidium nitens TaxID=105231 RepID=A0A1Y1IGJ0_KLENI|nr:hypothetical protein KFL_004440070 [Klebsormidium nitens]|eukprot:GAQ88609.1 hypothetical protein KFL_004440070 [Klebsormidium nitens]